MKVSEFLKDQKTADKAADLRAKLLYGFVFMMIGVVLFWVFRLACVAKLGFWYGLWNALYHLSRGLALATLIAIVVLWVYMLVMSIVRTKYPHGIQPEKADTSIDVGDLSNFD